MKLQPLTLPAEKAKKELKQYAIIGLVLSCIGLFVFWILGIIGLALSGRALVLTFHEAIKKENNVLKFRIIAVSGMILGLIDVIGFMSIQ
jgi:hypothetical protein